MNINELNTYEEIKDFIDAKMLEKQALMEALQEIEQETKKKIDAKEKELNEKKQAKMEALPNKNLFKKTVLECSNLENELATLKEELNSCQSKIKMPNDLLSEDEFYLITNKMNVISNEIISEYKQKELELLLQVEQLDKEEGIKQEELNKVYRQMITLHDFKNEYVGTSLTYGTSLNKSSFADLMRWMR